MTKESKQEKWDTSCKPNGDTFMITDSVFNAIEWEKHYTVKERQALNDVVDEIIGKSIAQSVQEAKAEMVDEIYDKGIDERMEGVYDPAKSMSYLERLHYEQHKDNLLTSLRKGDV